MPVMNLPLGLEVEYRGMRGHEEDLLTNKKKVMSGDAINEILANCVSRLGEKNLVRVEDIERLKSPDRMALLLAIRRESYGDEMDAEIECPNEGCRSKFEVTVDLSMLENKEPEGEPPFEVELSDGTIVTFDYLDGRREKSLLKVKENHATAALQHQIVAVKKPDGSDMHRNDIRAWLLNLEVRERARLRKAIDEKFCGPITEVTADCPYCGAEVTFDAVQGQMGFFFPET